MKLDGPNSPIGLTLTLSHFFNKIYNVHDMKYVNDTIRSSMKKLWYQTFPLKIQNML